MTVKTNLLNFSRQQMERFFVDLGEKPYRAQQVLQWIHQAGRSSFEEMTNLGKNLRETLNASACIELPLIVDYQASADGTKKWLLQLTCGNSIETVFIPEKNRGTLCVSSQVGCGLNCSFCSTAKQGFNRDLTTGEIIAQVWIANRELMNDTPDNMQKSGKPVRKTENKKITNVVMMGMGEPLLNFDNVTAAMDIMMDDFSYGLSKYRVTLSTSGLVPEMKRLSQASPVALAVSLHAPNDLLRNQLVPVNKKYPLKELMFVCKHYFDAEPRRKVTFEYVMLRDINDKEEHALQLAKLLRDMPAKVNLIPFNPFPLTQYQCSTPETIKAFQSLLMSKRIPTMVRKTRGQDIDAACGQLAGEFDDRTSRSQRWQKLHFQPVVGAKTEVKLASNPVRS